jgi:hypothetical protein
VAEGRGEGHMKYFHLLVAPHWGMKTQNEQSAVHRLPQPEDQFSRIPVVR